MGFYMNYMKAAKGSTFGMGSEVSQVFSLKIAMKLNIEARKVANIHETLF